MLVQSTCLLLALPSIQTNTQIKEEKSHLSHLYITIEGKAWLCGLYITEIYEQLIKIMLLFSKYFPFHFKGLHTSRESEVPLFMGFDRTAQKLQKTLHILQGTILWAASQQEGICLCSHPQVYTRTSLTAGWMPTIELLLLLMKVLGKGQCRLVIVPAQHYMARIGTCYFPENLKKLHGYQQIFS